MLSVLSQCVLPILFTWLNLLGVALLFWLRQVRKRELTISPETGQERLCGYHTRCDEHLYQISEPVKQQR